MSGPLLVIEGLTKDFPGQRALDDVGLTVGRGEIVALAGANGSGKSTLIKVLAGFHVPDAGRIEAFGEEAWPSGGSGWRSRCHFIHQDLGLIPTLSATDNIALASGYETRWGSISWRRQRAAARAALRRFGGSFDVGAPVGGLSPGQRTMVAIARALHGWTTGDALLVLDEPTAALHEEEVRRLFAATRRVAADGAGVIFVSHRIPEILELADRVVVLRDGRVAANMPVAGLSSDALVETIVGRKIDELYAEPPPVREDVVLSVQGIGGMRVRELSFDLHRGEILGVSGLLGSGRDELPSLLFGSLPMSSGTISVAGKQVNPSITESLRRGIALVPADRARHGAVMAQSVRENITLSGLRKLWRVAWIDRRAERREVSGWMSRLDVRPRNQDLPFVQLSGGNQQKAVLAKWLRTQPQIMVLDEPTQGVDVGAKAAIYKHLAEIAGEGTALVVCSSEAKDLAAICDRVIVMRDGRIASVLAGRDLTEQRIISETVGGDSAAPQPKGQE